MRETYEFGIAPPSVPSGHLPLKGGERSASMVRAVSVATVVIGRCMSGLLHSPPLRGRCRRSRQRGVSPLSRSGKVLLLVAALFLFPLPSFAVNPDEVLSDPALEQRARNLSAQLRCMVCQNQSIDDSNADLAKDLRVLVRERIVSGDSDEDVINYVVSRYGEFVLLKPRVSVRTYVLWGAPAVLLVAGAVAMLVYTRRRESPASAKLTSDEEARLEALLKDDNNA